jgi:hypothetical protein
MTKAEFTQLLASDRSAAIRLLMWHWVDEWMNDGTDEIVRVLSLWVDRGSDQNVLVPQSKPFLVLGDDEDVIEFAENKGVFDELTYSMSFKEFQAAYEDCPDLGKAINDDHLLGAKGRLYLRSFFIKDLGESPRGRWWTIIGRCEYQSDDLATVERHLYPFACTI